MLYAILKPFAVALMRLLWRLEGRGVQHLPREGAVLLVANHASVLDPPLVGGVSPRQVSFLAKAELFDIPLFGRFIRALNAHPVRREGSDPGALRTALKTLEQGKALLVFPEGTRSPDGTLRPGKAGAGMIAALSRAPVIPVYISGSGRCWPRGAWLPRPGKVTITFGPPLRFAAPAGAGRKDSYEAASREMMAAIARLKDGASPAGRVTSPREEDPANGEVGVGGASISPKYTDGRNGQHGEG